VAERGISRLQQWRGVATRHEQRAANDRAALVVRAIAIWLGR
jgi:transposase